MAEQKTSSEYLVLSRGQWEKDLPPEAIQATIDHFYTWLDQMVDEGKMRPGQRLATDGRSVSKKRGITDGPFGEAKEVIGGYWFVVAQDLDQAAEFMSGNPCIAAGLTFEVRPIEMIKASAFAVTNETPGD